MCYAWIPQAVMAIGAVYSGYQSYQQGQYQEDVGDYNARVQENEATRIRNKGNEEEMRHRQQVKQLIGEQRAAQAASGVDVNSGSPLQIQVDTAVKGEADALRIRENYEYLANATEQQASLTRMQGQAAGAAGRADATGSLFQAAGYGADAADTAGLLDGGGDEVDPSWYNSNSSARQSPQPGAIG